MTSSNLVTNEEVERACRSLGIKDWSTATGFTVSADEARAILNEVGGEAREVGLEDFREGLRIELEHGTSRMQTSPTTTPSSPGRSFSRI